MSSRPRSRLGLPRGTGEIQNEAKGGGEDMFATLYSDPMRLMSLNMLIETREGFDYTGADCRGWMGEAGFRESYVEPLVGPDSMVVGIK